MSHPGFRMGSNPMTGILIKSGGDTERHREKREEGPMNMEAEIGEMCLVVKEHQRWLATTRRS